MANDSNVLDKVGKYNLSELSIISYRQDKEESKPKFIDIKGIMLSMTITEDIFNSNLSGACTVYDTQDVRTIFPLTGLERLSVKILSLSFLITRNENSTYLVSPHIYPAHKAIYCLLKTGKNFP